MDEQHIIEIAFDTFENKRFREPDVLYPYLKEQIKGDGMYYAPLDEVQLLDGRNEYMLYGGLPPVINISNPEEKINFLKLLFGETYISDIAGRHNVRNH